MKKALLLFTLICFQFLNAFSQVGEANAIKIFVNGKPFDGSDIESKTLESMRFEFEYNEEIAKSYDKVVFFIETKSGGVIASRSISSKTYLGQKQDFSPTTILVEKKCEDDDYKKMCFGGNSGPSILNSSRVEEFIVGIQGVRKIGVKESYNPNSNQVIYTPIYGDGYIFAKQKFTVNPTKGSVLLMKVGTALLGIGSLAYVYFAFLQ